MAILAAARTRDRAPAGLRERIERERERAGRRAPARRLIPSLGAIAAVIAVAVALLLSSASPGAPTIAQAAALAVRGPAMPAPGVTQEPTGTRLRASVGNVYFPDWGASLGWKAVGARHDRLGGRTALTVYYARGGEQVAYTIVETPPLPEPSARVLVARGLAVRALTINGRNTVTWRRDGATCVLSAPAVDSATLADLASWSV